MNGYCAVCKHHWWDKSNRREVAWLFAAARSRTGATGDVLHALNTLELDCSKLAEIHLCTFDGELMQVPDCEGECENWEAVA